jgi:hypothetical protein
MVKHLIYLSLLIFISNAYSLHLSSQAESTIVSSSRNDPKMGCTIALRKKKDQDKVSAISFISEVQNSLGKGTYKECNIKY